MKKIQKTILLLLALLILNMVIKTATAQPAPVPYHIEKYELHSGFHENNGDETILAFQAKIQIENAPWLRLKFNSYNLGTGSYMKITSLKDNGWQILNSKTLPEWYDSSAFFNGDTLNVELYVAPRDEGIFFEIKEIMVGDWMNSTGGIMDKSKSYDDSQRTICGPTDDRLSSFDPRVGRIMPIGCTGWIISNGAHLTAGHCVDPGMSILEFNVPLSFCDGTPIMSSPFDQYPINLATVKFTNGGIGNDWAVFATNPNSNTGLLPVQAQGDFFRMTIDEIPSSVKVTGYGVDDDLPGCTGGFNFLSQTQQAHISNFIGEVFQGPSNVYIEYFVDTTGGNSGSPVIVHPLIPSLTMGIHTHGGCLLPSIGNKGTGFENDALENAIQTFTGLNMKYVDNNHPAFLGDGSIFKPFDKVSDAVAAVPNGGKISLVKSSYPFETFNTGGKAMTFVAPVGAVSIG